MMMYVEFSVTVDPLAVTEKTQQTPKPAAQLPRTEPPLLEHSELVRQVLARFR